MADWRDEEAIIAGLMIALGKLRPGETLTQRRLNALASGCRDIWGYASVQRAAVRLTEQTGSARSFRSWRDEAARRLREDAGGFGS